MSAASGAEARAATASATWAGCGAIALWAFLALLSRAAAGVPPFQIVATSFGLSALLGLGWLARRGELGQLRQPAPVWAHGIGGLFGFHALYFASLSIAPAATANLINYTWPLLLVLLTALVLRVRLSGRQWAGTGLALGGCGLLLSGGAAFPPGAGLGYALAAGSAVVWASYSILARRAFAAVPLGALAGFCGGTAVLAAIVQAALGGFVAPDGRAWAALLALGVGPVGAAFALWDVGMKRGDPRLLGTLAFATPVLSTLVLVAAGDAAFSTGLAGAAGLVAAGGYLAGR